MTLLFNNADTEGTELLEGKFENYPSRYEIFNLYMLRLFPSDS